MKIKRRWLKTVIATARDPLPALPYSRSTRRPPAARNPRPAAAAAIAVAAR